MDELLVGHMTYGNIKAEIYSTERPGEFEVVYLRDGKILERAPLTGISSYRQREPEIEERMRQLHEGGPTSPPDLGDPGEY